MATITPTTTPTSTLISYATNPGTLRAALTDPIANPGDVPVPPDDATMASALAAVLAEIDRRIPIIP